MSAYRIGQVGFAILGVYFVITGIAQVSSVTYMWIAATDSGFDQPFGNLQVLVAASVTLTVLLTLGAGYFVARNRQRLAGWAVGKEDDEPRLDAPGLPMAYSVVGVCVVIVYGSNVAGTIPDFLGDTVDDSHFIAQATALLLGLLLFFRSHWVARLWAKGGEPGREASVRSVGSRWVRAGRKDDRESEDG